MHDAPGMRSDHAWFRVRLKAQAFGLLDDDEAARFVAHAAACAPCADEMRAFAHDARSRMADGGHIPARLLARWDRATPRLRGLARRMVRAHLESCEACRQDLSMVGFTPVLELVADLEGEDEEPLDTRGPVAARSPVREPIPFAPRPTWRWVLGGALSGAAAAAAALLVVFRAGAPLDGGGATVTAPPRPPAVAAPLHLEDRAAPAQDPVFEVLHPPIMLQVARRSGEAATLTIPIAAGTRMVQVLLPDLFVPPSTVLQLHLTGPDGSELQRLTRPYRDLAGGGSVLIGGASTPLAVGRYRLVVVPDDPAGTPLAEFEFRIVPR